ncbi:hypothetical protein BG000_010248, partial [Podila horticola]
MSDDPSELDNTGAQSPSVMEEEEPSPSHSSDNGTDNNTPQVVLEQSPNEKQVNNEEEEDPGNVTIIHSDSEAEASSQPSASQQQSSLLQAPTSSSSRQSSPNGKRNSIVLEQTTLIKEPVPEPVPRLVIEKMVLVNFKSYAGRQEIGPFHKSFTSVVGPNGSGKSNVIDALLFVFGYRASKMRQGKLSELIHNSAGAGEIDSCKVEIHFCEILDLPGPDAFERIQGSNLVVARQAYTNNSSKYFINNFLSSYTEVTKLLKGRGIDLDHKRFLILQGEVESISQMKAKAQNEHEDGLLEYLEDIIGTSAYKETIEKSAVDLEALNDERSERLTRVKYVEKEKESLEAKKREAEAFLKNENSLAVKQSALYQICLYECNQKISRDTKKITQLTAKLEEDQNKYAGLKEEIQTLENEHNVRVKEYERIDRETAEVLKKLAKIDREDVQMQENKKHLRTKEKKATKALAADKHSLSDNQSWVRNHEADLVKHQAELERLEKNLEVAEDEMENIRQSLKGKTEEFSQQIEVHQKELAPWTEKIVAKQSQEDMAQSEHDLLEEKAKNSLASFQDAEAALETLKNAQSAKESEISELVEAIASSDGQIASIQAKIKNMADREKSLRDKASAARNRAEEGRASQQKSQSRSTVLTNLIRQRDLGKINGIQGRLGNLGAIDDKYDVAISTACPNLDDIVVGQQCIEFLRKNNLGRARFILLSQQAKRNLGPISTPENVPRLFDLVRPADPKFATAFYSVMQDTLVANDMAQANRIAYGRQRWRVVTLDGQLIDKSGTMTGGGTRVSRGAMSSTLSTGEYSLEAVQRMEDERDKAETELRFFLQEKASLDGELNSTVMNVPKMKMRLSMFQMDVQANATRIAETAKRVEALRAESVQKPADMAKMKQLAKKVADLQAEKTEIKKNAQLIEAKIKDLQNKILDAGGVKLRAQKSKVEGIREQIEALGDKVTKTKVAKNKAEKDIAKLGNQIAKHEKELGEVSEELERLEQDIKEKTQEAVGIRKRAEEAKQLMEEKKEEMEEMKQELDEKVKVVNKIRTAEVEMKNQLDDLKQSMGDLERREKQWKELLKALTLHEVDYDEDEIVAELHEISELDLGHIDKQDVEQQIAHLEQELAQSKPNLTVLEEYKKREEEYLARAKDLEDITLRREEAKKAYDELRKKRLDEFMAGFQIISLRLKEMYQMITLGGNAELELVDSLDPFSEGIIFSVMPPKKSWKNISNLSGGEKFSGAGVCAAPLQTNTALCDGRDAALDFRNVSIVANYIKERTKNAQFVIISLRNNMFELADRLVGIYKTDNKTKSISVNPSAITVLKPTPSGSGSVPPSGNGGPRRMSTLSRQASEVSSQPTPVVAPVHRMSVMSTAKTGLTVPFIPDPSTSKPSRSSRRHNNNKNNHPKHQLERSLSSHNGLNNINNSSSNLAAASPASTSSISVSTLNNAPNINNNGNNGGNNRNNSNRNGNRRKDNFSRRDIEVDLSLAAADGRASPSTRGYLSSKANRLDQEPVSRRDPNSTRSGPTGRLYDPKRDPVPVVPSPSTSQTQTSRPGEVRNPGVNHNQRQQEQRLYDPNQAQSNRHERQSSAPAAVSVSATSAQVSSNSTSTSSSSSNPPAAPPDGLVRLTKEIQALEKKVMEKPLRRSLDSDDDADYTRRGGNNGWSKRIDDSKRLASKYLRLMQLDFKSSLKHDIDTRCWKMAIYPLIEAFRAALRDSEGGNYSFSESDDDERETIRHYFTQFIATAQEFYVTLMTSLQALEAKHTPAASGTPRPMPPRWHRCVGIMGDLARYRWLHKLDDETDDLQPPTDWLVAARRLYREAIDLGPGNGKMYNQLALLAGCRGLESLYYYCKSLTVKSSFLNARDTLRSFFGANEQIRALQTLSLRQNAKARHAALAYTTLQDCEASFLLLQAMLFEKVNLDVFEKRLRMFLKQISSLHQHRSQDQLQTEHWDGLYFMMAVINLAGVYEFNWSSSIIAKSSSAFGDMPDDLLAVTTLPYSAKLLLATMEQSMLQYLSSIGDGQKVHCSTAEEQQGWLIYCHVVLAWMAGKPFGTSGDMMANWLFLANHETMPTFWTTLTTFMNHHWDQLTPFEQSDMLSALSGEMSDQHQEESTADSVFQLSTPPLGHEWELRGLAWMPTSRFGSKMFKGTPPLLDESELKGDSLWKQEAPKREHLSKRLVELSLIAALDMGVVEFDFCENAFKVNEEYAAQVQEAMSKNGYPSLVIDDYSTDDAIMSSSHASISQEESGFEDEGVYSDELDHLGDSSAAIMELKSKRDQLKMMLSESNRPKEERYGQRRQGRNKGGRGFTDRRQNQDQNAASRRIQAAENSILVIDTNCLVSDWTVVQRLVAADRWTVIIPLAVITELDGLKNNPAPLGPSAAGALSYLEGCLAQRPRMRRLKVQTSRGNYMNDLSFRVESFNYDQQPQSQKYYSSHRRSGSTDGNGFLSSEWEDDGDEEIMRNHNVDDFILGLCLWHHEHPASSSVLSPAMSSPSLGGGYSSSGSTIYLVTDDRNLRVKARARSVEVLGKDDI